MKKILAFCAMLVGAFTIMVGTSSCQDDETCCEWTNDDGQNYEACEDDAIVQSVGFSYFVQIAIEYGGTCD